ncbi:MAG: DegT/DnrJ/EryC1/StrS aminotransferase family protein, partial [Candidatus Omnitrophica bacterium]|nr:DegT/DnrJ/EryC1/StrS aminotransferase family protein [Candidatus Omnitrophota bacterium]
VPLNKMKAFKDTKIKGNLKNSEQSSKNVLSLPIHPFLKAEEINNVIKTVKNFFESGDN